VSLRLKAGERLRSLPARGARLLRLPGRKPREAPKAKEQPPPAPAVDTRPRVLVVGSLPGTRPRRMLGAAASVSSARPGEVGAALRAPAAPHVVLLDASLPTEQVKSVLATLGPPGSAGRPALIVVARPGGRSRVQAELLEHADDYVSEDVPERELLFRVRTALRMQGVVGELARKNDELQQVTGRLESLARRMAEELRLASNVQRSLLPPPFQHPRLEVAREFIPFREIGGDYYDFMPVGPQQIAVAIGDVMGKGVPAALMAATLKSSVRAQAHAQAGRVCPQDLVAHVNQLFWEVTRSGLFASVFFGVFDFEAQRFDYVNAGHQHPFLMRADGSSLDLSEGGTVVGLVEGTTYEGASVSLRRDDLLVFYSDGVTDRENGSGDLYGVERLKVAALRSRKDPARIALYSLLADIQDWSRGVPAEDDATLIVARVR
jgi:serine phosphatase RsbU (regulator of sigma subunit)